MKKKVKQIFVALFVAVMLVGAAPIATFNVSAASCSADEAINWLWTVNGKSLDYDGAYGAQCVDLIAYYYANLGATTPGGNANQYSSNALPAGWQRTKGGTPQKGDILVYAGGSGNGHVAIYESDTVTWHQNWSGHYVQRLTGRSYKSLKASDGSPYWGCIHPNFNNIVDTQIPYDMKITADRSVISVGETVTFNYSISGAATKYLGIDHAGGSRYATKEVSSDSGSTTYTFNEPGTYCCIIEGRNSLGYNCSHGVYVTVIDTAPTDCKISVSESSKTLIPIGSTVTFNYAIRGASRICLGIDYAGGSRYDSKRVYNDEGTISYTFTKASTYCCIIEGWNNVGYNCSPGVYVTVFDPNFSIKFDANGGVCSTSSKNVSYGSMYGTLPTPNRSGYNFVGWYTKPSGGVKISASDTVSITGETTFYAHWIKNSETKAVVKDVKIEHNATVNYKSTYMLSPEITADKGAKYTVKYSSSNPKVATVDENGKIYGAKKGNATITCTVTDSYGNVVTDKCNVNVDYSGSQWFIIIVLFGWIWYI